PLGSQVAGRLAGRDDLAVLHVKGARGAVDVDPPAQAVTVEERRETVVLAVARLGVVGDSWDGQGQAQQQGAKATERSHEGPLQACGRARGQAEHWWRCRDSRSRWSLGLGR